MQSECVGVFFAYANRPMMGECPRLSKRPCSRFTFPPNYFDVVHSQMMAGGIHANRWRSYLQDIYRVLQPGGWCQMVEMYFNAQSDNGTLSPGIPPLALCQTIELV